VLENELDCVDSGDLLSGLLPVKKHRSGHVIYRLSTEIDIYFQLLVSVAGAAQTYLACSHVTSSNSLAESEKLREHLIQSFLKSNTFDDGTKSVRRLLATWALK